MYDTYWNGEELVAPNYTIFEHLKRVWVPNMSCNTSYNAKYEV